MVFPTKVRRAEIVGNGVLQAYQASAVHTLQGLEFSCALTRYFGYARPIHGSRKNCHTFFIADRRLRQRLREDGCIMEEKGGGYGRLRFC